MRLPEGDQYCLSLSRCFLKSNSWKRLKWWKLNLNLNFTPLICNPAKLFSESILSCTTLSNNNGTFRTQLAASDASDHEQDDEQRGEYLALARKSSLGKLRIELPLGMEIGFQRRVVLLRRNNRSSRVQRYCKLDSIWPIFQNCQIWFVDSDLNIGTLSALGAKWSNWIQKPCVQTNGSSCQQAGQPNASVTAAAATIVAGSPGTEQCIARLMPIPQKSRSYLM